MSSAAASEIVLKVDGEVQAPREFSFADLAAIDAAHQIVDVSRIDPARAGDAVSLQGLLELVRPREHAQFLGLHSAHDDFHASIPLADVVQRAFVIYRLEGEPLPRGKGGPARFYIPDHASCNTQEIDECANVKFVDHIELTREKGFDNRPQDEAEHAKLHESGEHG
jgi:DMSO/TMAO reductase YedYZ molybdopterin-dependent catalytic subunit